VVLCADLVGADNVPHNPGRLWAWPIIVDFRWVGSAVNWAAAHQVTSFSFSFSYFFPFPFPFSVYSFVFKNYKILQAFLYLKKNCLQILKMFDFQFVHNLKIIQKN
jgi:hypothetical protein